MTILFRAATGQEIFEATGQESFEATGHESFDCMDNQGCKDDVQLGRMIKGTKTTH